MSNTRHALYMAYIADRIVGRLVIDVDADKIMFTTKCCNAEAIANNGFKHGNAICVCMVCHAEASPMLTESWDIDDADAWDRYEVTLHIAFGKERAAGIVDAILADIDTNYHNPAPAPAPVAGPAGEPIILGAIRATADQHAAATTTGMLGADQDSTGMLF